MGKARDQSAADWADAIREHDPTRIAALGAMVPRVR